MNSFLGTHGEHPRYGLHDRGTLEVGLRADLNVVDLWGALSLEPPMSAYDLPLGGRRILQVRIYAMHARCGNFGNFCNDAGGC